MTLPFNYKTLQSTFDKRATLLNQLKDMEDTFAAAGLTGIEVVDETATSLKLKMTFADGSSFTTSAIDIKGAKGDTGDPATVAVGTVTTGAAGSDATVTNVGTSSNAVFDFSIPRGDTGAAGGITNVNGYTGAVTTGNGLAFNNGALSSYDFNLTDTGVISTATGTDVDITGGSLYKALNADKSIGKIYGRVLMKTATTIAAAGQKYVDTGFIVEAPAAQYYMLTGGIALTSSFDTQRDVFIRVRTDGHVEVGIYVATTDANKTFYVYFPACIYFFKDFGDTPQAQTLSMRMAALEPIESEER